MSEPFQHSAGPHDAKTVFVGEAWGAEEEELGGQPFVGQAGRELARMLGEAWNAPTLRAAAHHVERDRWLAERDDWLTSASVLLTNVFALRPQNNNLAHLCCSKEELPNDYDLSPVRTQSPRYVRAEFLPELARLREELATARPNLVVALGGTASWALLGRAGIGSIRGAIAESTLVPGTKCLPSYHPAGVIYQWSLRSTVIADLVKADNERRHSEIVRPERRVQTSPSIEDLEETTQMLLSNARLLAPDIETLNGQIRCIGFAWTRQDAIVVPFIRDLTGASYWFDLETELRAWECVRALLESDIPKVGQNFLFDLQYLERAGIRTRNVAHDTMLLHHVMYPELPKGLGFLGSVYTNESAWKLLRKHGEELKRDE